VSVPVLHTFVVGEVVTAANINNNTLTLGNFILNPPRVVLRQTVAQSLANNAYTSVTFDTEDVDSDNAHSTASNTSRVTANTPGYWRASGSIGFAGNTAGRRATRWAVNGTALNGGQILLGPATWTGLAVGIPAVTRDVFLNGTGDYLELQAFQDSGGALNSDVGAQQSLLVATWAATS
jgi:hypothetical protein